MLFKEIVTENWKVNTLLKQISGILILKKIINNAQRALKKWKFMICSEINRRMSNRHIIAVTDTDCSAT